MAESFFTQRGGALDDQEVAPVINAARESLVAQGFPPRTELSRLG